MKYRQFLNSLPNAELAQIIASDDIYNMACVDNYEHKEHKCPHSYSRCAKCIEELLDREMDE